MGTWRTWAVAALLSLGAGCNSMIPLDAPPPPTTATNTAKTAVAVEANPVFIPLGPNSYGKLFENCLSVLSDYQFEIAESNRYDGRIEAFPRTAPGLGLFFKPGNTDFYDRLLCTTQSYRHRVSLAIQPADNGGYFIDVTARKELEVLPRPIRQSVGAAIFRNESTLEREYEVIDPAFFSPTWLSKGRDFDLEQELIRRLKGCM